MHFRHENHLVQPLTNDVLIGWIKKVDKELKSWRKVVAVDHPILRFSTHGVKSMVMFDLYIEVQTSYNPFYIQSELKNRQRHDVKQKSSKIESGTTRKRGQLMAIRSRKRYEWLLMKCDTSTTILFVQNGIECNYRRRNILRRNFGCVLRPLE